MQTPGLQPTQAGAPNASANAIKVVAPVKGALPVALPDGLKSGQNLAGKYVEAFIQSRQDEAKAMVRVGNQVLELTQAQAKQLAHLRVGQKVILRFEQVNGLKGSAQPKAGDFSQTRVQVNDGAALAGTVSKSVALQSAARVLMVATQLGFLSEVQNKAEQGKSPEQTGQARVPLGVLLGLGEGEDDPAQFLSRNTAALARQLQVGVSKSGLFYESHLEQWVMGKVHIDELAEEPQFDWNRASALTNESAKNLSPEQERSAMVASQQLNVLDNPKIILTLPGLFGEKIEIEIFPDPLIEDDDQSKEEAETERGWNFTLSMDLGNLGPLHAHFRAAGGEVALNIETSEQAYPLFESKSDEIAVLLDAKDVRISRRAETG